MGHKYRIVGYNLATRKDNGGEVTVIKFRCENCSNTDSKIEDGLWTEKELGIKSDREKGE